MPERLREPTTDRLILRHLASTDVDFVLAHFSHPDVDRFLVDDDPVATREEAQAIVDYFVHTPGPLPNRWVLTLRDDGTPIGTIGFHVQRERDRRCEIGYDLSPQYWGRGYMSEALGAVLALGFDELFLNRIGAIVHPENAGSLRLLERFGFSREGVLRDWHCRDGIYHDHVTLSLLAREWRRSAVP